MSNPTPIDRRQPRSAGIGQGLILVSVIVQTDAVVLQTRRFRETSKIVTLYTREYGRMGVVARGVMTPRSRTASVLQPMARIATVIYRKEGRELQNLSQAEELDRYRRVTSDLDRMSAGLAIVELINATMHDEDRNDRLFEVLTGSLAALDAEAAVPRNVLLWFMVHLSEQLGFLLATEHCGVCASPIQPGESVPYSLALGAPLCADDRDSAGYDPMGRASFELLRSLCHLPVDEAASLEAASHARAALLETLTSFIKYHVAGMRRLNVNQVALKLLGEIARA